VCDLTDISSPSPIFHTVKYGQSLLVKAQGVVVFEL
jgi:hypothetical protein